MKAGTVFRIAGWVLAGVAAGAALGLLLGVAVWALWNWLAPAVSRGALGTITYWQAVGLFILCHLLFKSHHEHHGHERKDRKGPGFFRDRVRALIGKGGAEAGQLAPNVKPRGPSRPRGGDDIAGARPNAGAAEGE